MTDHAALIRQIRTLLEARRVADAERVLLDALTQNNRDTSLLALIAEFYEQLGRSLEAAKVLTRLTELEPQESGAYFRLAELFDRLGRNHDALVVYTRLCAACPDLADAHFNRAIYLRRMGQLDESIAAYRRAIDLGVANPADAWSNVGVILGDLERHAEARAAFAASLAADPRWLPAHYNLGLLHEEFGERDAALTCFARALAIEPNYHQALARLVHATPFTEPDDPRLRRVRELLDRSDLPDDAREALSFALGKALDECGRYDDAFAAFAAANRMARARARPYERHAVERDNAAIRETFSAAWLNTAPVIAERPLVFVCGMFRSGTTLLEQMLAAHSAFTAGGEIRYFNDALGDEFAGYPAIIAAAGSEALRALGKNYLAHLDARFPGARVINKRPDNVRYLGLLAGLFPAARFVVMRRNPGDTCLSIFSQQFGDALRYATDLDDTAHYLQQLRGLVMHWQGLFPERILEVAYEALVSDPEPELRRVCEFLGVPFEPSMLGFTNNDARVRTASVWQVRRPLHTTSIGRHRHYARHLPANIHELHEEQHADER